MDADLDQLTKMVRSKCEAEEPVKMSFLAKMSPENRFHLCFAAKRAVVQINPQGPIPVLHDEYVEFPQVYEMTLENSKQ